MRKRWLAVLTMSAVLVYASSAGGSSSKSGGTFRLATSSGIDSLNPYLAFNQDAYSMFEYIYPLLVQYDKDNKQFVPDFARAWTASKDGKTWTFTTVAGAKWSDGKPLTAADAAWTINTDIKYQGGGAANAAGLIAHIKHASAPNPTTLIVHYKAAPGNVLGQFQQFAILPRHVWSKHTGHKGADLKTFPNNPPIVGAGSFKLVKYKKNQIALFQRNNSFYGTKPQLKPEAYDLGLANKLLDQIGYKRGAGGIRVAGGHKMTYDVITPTSVQSAPRTFQIIQNSFAKIGVQLRQKALDATAAFDLMTSPNGKYLNFDLALWDWVALIDPDFMLSVVTCAQYGGWSDSAFCDKKYDHMYSQQQLTPDQGKRRAIVWQMQKYLYDRRPYIWLAAQDSVDALSSKWTGLVPSPQGPFNSLSKASLTSVHQK